MPSINLLYLHRRLWQETERAKRERFGQVWGHTSRVFVGNLTLFNTFTVNHISIQLEMLLDLFPVANTRFKTYVRSRRAFLFLRFLAVKFLFLFHAIDLLCFDHGCQLCQSLLRGFPVWWTSYFALFSHFARPRLKINHVQVVSLSLQLINLIGSMLF